MRRPGRSGILPQVSRPGCCAPAHPRSAPFICPTLQPQRLARLTRHVRDARLPDARMHAPRPSPSPGNRRHLVGTEKLVGHRMRPFPRSGTPARPPAVVNMISSSPPGPDRLRHRRRGPRAPASQPATAPGVMPSARATAPGEIHHAIKRRRVVASSTRSPILACILRHSSPHPRPVHLHAHTHRQSPPSQAKQS